ncbi:hypothetical protein PIB30_048177 [Stylosanthes scabra]|uniref:EamA domain-containing protein n=1 Tax=Stylosanthes scabra TaxID=79078 RepID=A0ABU6XG07_9FABA|nr:hypothetical protein [Stylosanthes scabra]
MVSAQIALAAVNILYKMAINDGMNMRVATAYRLIFASVFAIPVAIIFDRKNKKNKAKITPRVLLLEFLCALFGGTLCLNFYFAAMPLMPATFVLAIVNLSPALTFIIAITTGLEKLNLGAAAGKAKVIGTVTGISGAMVLTFYKGIQIDVWSSYSRINLLHHPHGGVHNGNKLLGFSYAIASCCSYALWLNIQAKVNQEFPRHYTGTALMCSMAALQSTVFALFVDRDWASQWKLSWNIRLLTVSYAGIVASGIVINIIAWCVHMRGPLFGCIFNPLQLVLVAIAASFTLDEHLYLGSVIGGVLIVSGLYSVLWGNSTETKHKIQDQTQLLEEITRDATVQISFVAVNILYKMAINDGMSMRVATAYRLIFASAFTIPIAIIFDTNNKKNKAKITPRVLLLEFLCGLFGGTLFLNFYFAALALMPATFVLAIINLCPAVTFIIAITSGLEKLNLGAAAGKAKVIGTITGISGAMVLTFYKGIRIDTWSSHINLLHHPHGGADNGNKLLGFSYAIASCSSFALWLNIQAKVNQEFPRHHTGTALMCSMAALQSTVFALFVDRDWASQWKLSWNIRLLTVSYAGIVASGLVVNIIAWCVHKRGPLFGSIFNPLQLVLVAIAASFLLNEHLYLGSVIGGVLIVSGLYSVLWGNSTETKHKIQDQTQLLEEITRDATVQVIVMSPQKEQQNKDNKTHHHQIQNPLSNEQQFPPPHNNNNNNNGGK